MLIKNIVKTKHVPNMKENTLKCGGIKKKERGPLHRVLNAKLKPNFKRELGAAAAKA